MRICVVLLMLMLAAAPGNGPAAASHRITYLTTSTAYIDAGRDEGIVAGARVEVVRKGVVVGLLRVTDVSSHRAACAIESSSADLAMGDTVRFEAVALPDEPAPVVAPVRAEAGAAAGEAPLARQESWARRMGLRGRIGVRYLTVLDQSGFGGDVSQPSADIRVDGRQVGGKPIDMQVDVRARHTVQTVSDGSEYNDGEARVYRLNAAWTSPRHHVRVTGGRQFSSALTSVSTFDGVQAEYDRARWGTGLFAGTQPSATDYSFSTDIEEYGAFVRFRSAPRTSVNWEAAAAAIGSYEGGKINREYLSLVGRANSARASGMIQQDIDINRGWRHDAEGSSTSLTSTFLTGRYRLTKMVDVDAGYDNRRDVRVYRDFVSPETQFDDDYRRGVWGGFGLRFAQRYRVGLSARSSGGGSAGDAMSYTGLFTAGRVTPAHLDFRLRSARYENDRSTGWMHSLSAGIAVGAMWNFELYGGVRDDAGRTPSTPDVHTSWFGANVDMGLGRNWYVNVSGEHNGTSGAESYHQIYSSVSYRF